MQRHDHMGLVPVDTADAFDFEVDVEPPQDLAAPCRRLTGERVGICEGPQRGPGGNAEESCDVHHQCRELASAFGCESASRQDVDRLHLLGSTGDPAQLFRSDATMKSLENGNVVVPSGFVG